MKYFIDTEFIERGPEQPIRLLSIGVVAEDGREYYYEQPDARHRVNDDHVRYGDRWLIENVRPHLHYGAVSPWYSVNVASDLIAFCYPDDYGPPKFWGYYADYDWVVFCQVFGRMIDLPKGWPMYCRDLKQVMDEYEIDRKALPLDPPNAHHALADAQWTKQAYETVSAIVEASKRVR